MQIFEYENITADLDLRDIVFLNNKHANHLLIKQIGEKNVELKAKSFIGKIFLPSGKEIIIKPKIKINNLLYIISYTFDFVNFNYWDKKEFSENDALIEIYIIVLLNWIEKLLQKGLYKSYETHTNALSTIKGKIYLKENLTGKNKIVCQYDEISFSTIENQIIKATLLYIIRSKQISTLTRQRALLFYRILKEVAVIQLTKSLFKRLIINRLNNHYKPIMELCELIYNNLRLGDETGDTHFSGYMLNMNTVYEQFIIKALQKKMSGEKIKKSSKRNWTDFASDDYLPQITPDIIIGNKAIIDAKYYKTPFSNTGHYISNHIYQLITYLKAYKIKKGYLVYPEPDSKQSFDSSYYIDDINFNVFSIPLNGNINDIEGAIEKLSRSILKMD